MGLGAPRARGGSLGEAPGGARAVRGGAGRRAPPVAPERADATALPIRCPACGRGGSGAALLSRFQAGWPRSRQRPDGGPSRRYWCRYGSSGDSRRLFSRDPGICGERVTHEGETGTRKHPAQKSNRHGFDRGCGAERGAIRFYSPPPRKICLRHRCSTPHPRATRHGPRVPAVTVSLARPGLPGWPPPPPPPPPARPLTARPAPAARAAGQPPPSPPRSNAGYSSGDSSGTSAMATACS